MKTGKTEKNKTTKNIYQKMAEIASKVKTVKKNLNVSTHKGSYKAVAERDIIEAVKGLEYENGVYSYPHTREIVASEMLTSTNTYNGKSSESTKFFLRLKTVYRFVNCDNPTEYVEMTTYADGIDSGDKANGKAMTYCDKYALMKAYKIETGDDPDQEVSQETLKQKAYPPKTMKDLKRIMIEYAMVTARPFEDIWAKYQEQDNHDSQDVITKTYWTLFNFLKKRNVK
jgi:hypothetical protein